MKHWKIQSSLFLRKFLTDVDSVAMPNENLRRMAKRHAKEVPRESCLQHFELVTLTDDGDFGCQSSTAPKIAWPS